MDATDCQELEISNGNPSQIEMISSGSNYEIAKEIAIRSDAHIITDLKTRWKFIEIDRREGNVDDSGWEPFAKSIQQAKLETLNTTSLDFSLRLRKEDRLKGCAHFCIGFGINHQQKILAQGKLRIS